MHPHQSGIKSLVPLIDNAVTRQQKDTGSMILIHMSQRECPFNTRMPDEDPPQWGPSWETWKLLPTCEDFPFLHVVEFVPFPL